MSKLDEAFWDRIKQPNYFGVQCCECGDELHGLAYYEVGVNTRDVTLCLACARALHREAKRKAARVDSLLLERY